MTDTALSLNQVSKAYGVDFGVHDLNLELPQEQILALVGPSGCGKTTTLRLIAGFERPEAGTIYLGGRLLADPYQATPPEKRGIGMVFQDHALFPHLTVGENVAFGLRRRDNGQRERVRFMLALVGLEAMAGRFPHELSGGERQRVALARALVPEPAILLLDEPFSNLDADLRLKMREEVRVILKGIQATAIFVTHDQEEALYMGDLLAVMNAGRIEQIGKPEAIFHTPQTRFVADFMGETDFLEGEVTAEGIRTEIGVVAQQAPYPTGTQVELALRPDDVSFTPKAGAQSLVLARRFTGALNVYRLRLPSGHLLHAFVPHHHIYQPGTPVEVRIDPGHELACFAKQPATNS
jgi:iron(III) transport system ATP-binding protein